MPKALLHWLEKHERPLLPIVVALLAGLQTSYLVTLSVRELAEAGVALDDSYFYAVLAQNYQRLGYLTFDGSMPTNGVQPLWQGLLIALHWAFPNVEVMRLCFTASWLAYAGFCWLLVRHVVRLDGMPPLLATLAVSLLVACNPNYQRIVLNGLEPALFLLCFGAWLNLMQSLAARWPVGSARQIAMAMLLACLAGLCFLARTDWFWLVPLSALFVWRQQRRLLLLGGGAAVVVLVVGPYLLHNWLTYGHLVPISGRVKLELLEQFAPTLVQYFQTDEWRGAFSLLAGMLLFEGFWLAVLLAGALCVFAVRHYSAFEPSVRWMLLAVACHAVFMHLVYGEVRPYTRYYFSVEGLAAAYLLLELLSRARKAWQRSHVERSWLRPDRVLPALLATALLVSLMLVRVEPRAGWVLRVRMAEDLRALPDAAKVAAYWPGALAYFSGRMVFPLDGIIGSQWYLDHVVRRQRELEYARERGIDHIVIHDLPMSKLQDTVPPEVGSWSHMGKLRLWQHCPYVVQLVAQRANPKTGNGWYLYRLSSAPKNDDCQGSGRSPPGLCGVGRRSLTRK